MLKSYSRAALAFSAAVLLLCGLPQKATAADKTVVVALVAANAKASFADVAAAFEKLHPNLTVQTTYAGSKVITAQIEQGAQADVIIVSGATVVGATGLGTPRLIFKNHTAIGVAKAAAAKIHSVVDLAKPGIRIAGGTPGSTVGTFQADTLAKLSAKYGKSFENGYNANVIGRKTDSNKVAAMVIDGTADAGIMFAAEIDPAKLNVIALSNDLQIDVSYIVADVKASTHAAIAHDFADFISGPDAAAIFRAHRHDPK